jgi:uncharacterized protein YukE
MAQAIGDPDELERFAHSVSQFVETLDDAVGALDGSFNALGESWQDEKRTAFEDEYREMLRSLAQFKEAASEQVPYLLTLATRLRDYLAS